MRISFVSCTHENSKSSHTSYSRKSHMRHITSIKLLTSMTNISSANSTQFLDSYIFLYSPKLNIFINSRPSSCKRIYSILSNIFEQKIILDVRLFVIENLQWSGEG